MAVVATACSDDKSIEGAGAAHTTTTIGPAGPPPPVTTPESTIGPSEPDTDDSQASVTTRESTIAPQAQPVGRVVFISDVDGILGGLDSELVVINANGTGRTHLADLFGGGDPVWSPDGTQVAFGTLVNRTTTQTFVVRADGTGTRQLTDFAGAGMFYDWSPDGSQIVFNGNDRLYVMNADGSDQTRLSDLIIGIPAWSPDGTRIAFEAENGERIDIYVIGPDGTGLTRLTDAPLNYFYFLESSPWSPDSSRIAFGTELLRDPESLIEDPLPPLEVRRYLISPDGSHLEELELMGSWGWSWSPDGSRIAFANLDGRLSVMNRDGSNVTQLTEQLILHPAYGGPSWSPTGIHIVFSGALTRDEQTANYDIYVIAADGSSLTRLTTEPGDDIEPVWSPTP